MKGARPVEKPPEDFHLVPAIHDALRANYDVSSQHVFLAAVMV